MILLLVMGCPTEIGPDDICKEVGYAIAGRTQECTGDVALAESRYTAFSEDYTCIASQGRDTAIYLTEDLYACPLGIRNLACELVESYGDDTDAWLQASPFCALIVERR